MLNTTLTPGDMFRAVDVQPIAGALPWSVIQLILIKETPFGGILVRYKMPATEVFRSFDGWARIFPEDVAKLVPVA
ncbi:hypothetical protein AB0K16_22170 [Nonomuraea jabiensis]|uniref:hypothetical protein n=1 Tax=Nonomuraea jabiensis TaxID=882448 RepID=UPI00342C6286